MAASQVAHNFDDDGVLGGELGCVLLIAPSGPPAWQASDQRRHANCNHSALSRRVERTRPLMQHDTIITKSGPFKVRPPCHCGPKQRTRCAFATAAAMYCLRTDVSARAERRSARYSECAAATTSSAMANSSVALRSTLHRRRSRGPRRLTTIYSEGLSRAGVASATTPIRAGLCWLLRADLT